VQVRGNFQGPGRLQEPTLQTKIFPEFMDFPAWRVVWKVREDLVHSLSSAGPRCGGALAPAAGSDGCVSAGALVYWTAPSCGLPSGVTHVWVTRNRPAMTSPW
jgi:hypothetical protein